MKIEIWHTQEQESTFARDGRLTVFQSQISNAENGTPQEQTLAAALSEWLATSDDPDTPSVLLERYRLECETEIEADGVLYDVARYLAS